jgi:hypothetical protein
MNKAQEFIDYAFSLPNNRGVKCPCSRCRNVVCEDKRTLALQLCKVGFMPGYKVGTHHGESIRQTASVAEDEDDKRGDDKINEMLDAIRPELERNPKDPPTLEVQKFLEDTLSASDEALHEHMTVSVLNFMSSLMTIKLKFAFSNNGYKEFLNLINDILPDNHKMPKDMYQ